MPQSNFNVHYLRVVNPDDDKAREFLKMKKQVSAYRPQEAEQLVREEELRHGFGFIRGKVKLDLREAYAKRKARNGRR